MENKKEEILFKDIDLHPALKDIEAMFRFFILSHKILIREDVKNIVQSKESHFYVSLLEKYYKEINIQTNYPNIKGNMIFMGKSIAILLFDYLSMSKYNNEISKLKDFVFLSFIRNGAAHNNEFKFKGRNNKETKEGEKLKKHGGIVEWRVKQITENQDRVKVFNDFINIFEVFVLANDFSEKLFEIDSRL